MEIIFAAAHLPVAQGREAGQKTSYYLCQHLAKRHNVHLLAFASERERAGFTQDDLGIYASSELFPLNNSVRLAGILSAPGLPIAIAARHSASYRRRLRALMRKIRPDVVIFDHTAMFQYAADVPSSVVTMGSAHDICSQGWRRKVEGARSSLKRVLLGIEAHRMETWEKRVCARLDFVVPHNDKDRKLIEELQPGVNAMAIDAWVSLPVCDASAQREPGSIIFWGAMNRPENVDAARWAANEILPQIRSRVPHARLYIAGNHGEQLAAEFAGREDVVITGFVQDVGALMSRMELALLPLRLGAGIKIKTLECMAAGLPVVTTSVGEEGIGGMHDVHYSIGESVADLALQASRLLEHKSEADQMGRRAKEFIAANHNFAKRIDILEDALMGVIAQRSHHALAKTV